MQKTRFAAAMLLAGAIPFSATANDRLEPVVVTAHRIAQTADESLAPVTIIGRDEIARARSTDIADILRFHAGMEIGRAGGAGQPASLFLRGSNSDHVLVMIDGVKLNSATTGGAAWQHMDLAHVERIEIVKGPRSALYGSEAIGGVVNIITRRAEKGVQATVGTEAGSFETRQGTASLHLGHGALRAGVDVSAFATDAFPAFADADRNDGHSRRTVNGYLRGQFARGLLEASIWDSRGHTEYGVIESDPVTWDFLGFGQTKQDFHNQTAALRAQWDVTGAWRTAVTLGRNRDELSQRGSDDFADTRRHSVDWQNDFQFGDSNLLTVGASWIEEDTQALSWGSGYDETTLTRSVYVQDSIGWGRHNLIVAARHTRHDDFGSHNTWNVDYGLDLTASTRLLVGAGTAFAAPTASARFGYGANPDLDPETSRNVEVGLRHSISTGQSIALSAFDNRVRNLIVTEFDASFTPRNENVARARIRGVEAQYDLQLAAWRLHLAAILQEPRDETNDQRLLRRARRSVSLDTGYRLGRVDIGSQLLWVGPRMDADALTGARVETDAYLLANLTARWQLTRDWHLTAKIENVLDTDYELAAGYATPGRGYFLGIAYQPRR